MLYILPPGKTGINAFDAINTPKYTSSRTHYNTLKSPIIESRGPIEDYLPYLNAILGLLLCFVGLVHDYKSGWEENLWFRYGTLPGAVYLIVLVAKVVMGSVDVEELEELKYNYKGA